jgi:hypothetical protein
VINVDEDYIDFPEQDEKSQVKERVICKNEPPEYMRKRIFTMAIQNMQA